MRLRFPNGYFDAMQTQPLKPKLTFKFDWKTTLFVVLMFPVLLYFGVWQLERAAQKQAKQDTIEMRKNQDPQPIENFLLNTYSGIDSNDRRLDQQPVLLSGKFINEKTYLIDNQIYQGQFGYDVVTPFQLSSNHQVILIGRGWVKGALDRSQLPPVPAVDGQLDLRGRIYISLRQPYLIGEAEHFENWPKRVAFIDFTEAQKALGLEVFPYMVRISENQPGSLVRHWHAQAGLTASHHRGYAFQWFALAATLIILYGILSSNIIKILFHRGSQPSTNPRQ